MHITGTYPQLWKTPWIMVGKRSAKMLTKKDTVNNFGKLVHSFHRFTKKLFTHCSEVNPQTINTTKLEEKGAFIHDFICPYYYYNKIYIIY